MKNKVLIIAGPTASGKTDLSIEIALKYNGEIISADSMQIYRGMDIGTAKITDSEKNGVMHYMIDIVDPDADFSVAEYQTQAKAAIYDIISREKMPIVVGGTGLYIHSIIKDVNFTKTVKNSDFRESLINIDTAELYKRLLDADPDSAGRINPNDKKRIIRRLEIINDGDTDRTYDFQKKNDEFDCINIFLNPDRSKLYDRINRRVDLMFDNGLIQEVENIKGIYKDGCTALQAIGYKEVVSYLDDNNKDMESLKELIKINTRHYAKRQITWFKQYDDFKWFDIDSYCDRSDLIEAITDYINSRINK